MKKNIIMPGDQFAKKGTTPWADWQRSRMKHALKDVNLEARQLVQVIRDMCSGEKPAWHLMTRENGIGFRTFEEFVTSPDGLRFPDYPKFRGIALSEPGIMNEREYDLLTTAPAMKLKRPDIRPGRISGASKDKTAWLRSIARADPDIYKMFLAGQISLTTAALMGSREAVRHPQKAARALAAIRAISRNGDDKAYRKEVNKAVLRAFGKTKPTPLDTIKRVFSKASKRDQDQIREWIMSQ